MQFVFFAWFTISYRWFGKMSAKVGEDKMLISRSYQGRLIKGNRESNSVSFDVKMIDSAFISPYAGYPTISEYLASNEMQFDFDTYVTDKIYPLASARNQTVQAYLRATTITTQNAVGVSSLSLINGNTTATLIYGTHYTVV